MVNPIPDGYPRVIPYLTVEGAPAAIEFYVAAFDAKERMRMPGPEGKIGHAEVEVGDSLIMLADASDMSGPSPAKLGGSPVTVMMYVPDVDATYQRALAEGATSVSEPEDMFYGDRSAGILDPFGHRWHLSSHVEDVSEEEMDKRMKQMTGG